MLFCIKNKLIDYEIERIEIRRLSRRKIYFGMKFYVPIKIKNKAKKQTAQKNLCCFVKYLAEWTSAIYSAVLLFAISIVIFNSYSYKFTSTR
ncbi:hypothetical protein BV913_07380 [Neisseria dumasiana]|uniref:Uncharacterized protein n=1 Tax=Neisseria dumasiana TaxID=1931275 RepID=A0ABX3WM67_9NEIS|nr:hypothetical protein BV913_07380 [Neisseria dumasiana]